MWVHINMRDVCKLNVTSQGLNKTVNPFIICQPNNFMTHNQGLIGEDGVNLSTDARCLRMILSMSIFEEVKTFAYN